MRSNEQLDQLVERRAARCAAWPRRTSATAARFASGCGRLSQVQSSLDALLVERPGGGSCARARLRGRPDGPDRRPAGHVRAIYAEEFDLAALGRPWRSRVPATVEPAATAAGTPTCAVSGPVLGPFDRRSEALVAELDWLEAHWLVRTPDPTLPASMPHARRHGSLCPTRSTHFPASRDPPGVRLAGPRRAQLRGISRDPGPARPRDRRGHRRVDPDHSHVSVLPPRPTRATRSPRRSAWSRSARSAASRSRTRAGGRRVARRWPSACAAMSLRPRDARGLCRRSRRARHDRSPTRLASREWSLRGHPGSDDRVTPDSARPPFPGLGIRPRVSRIVPLSRGTVSLAGHRSQGHPDS